jgi:peptidyl-prolyl cis-trans isomerase D
MLQKLRDQTQSLAFKVLIGIIVFVLAVFGFGAFNLFATGDPELAKVNRQAITQSMLVAEAERERRRLAAQLGPDFDPGLIDPVRLQSAVLEQLIARALLAQAADSLGVTASDAQVAAALRRNPNFQVDGVFQESRFRLVAQGLGYTPQGFFEETREIMSLEQIQNGLLGSALVTDQEVRNHARLLGQRRDLAYLAFTVDRFVDQVVVADADVALRYEENRLDFMTEENVDVEFVELTLASLAADQELEIGEEALREIYEADREGSPVGEERNSRHILLTLSAARDAAAAEAEILALRARIEAGEAFADVAREVSEDPGSAATGGELGLAGRGVFDPDFEAALFALVAPGDLSGPVATEFGYHLIQLEEIRAVEYPEFEAARPEIEDRLRRERAFEQFQVAMRELDNLAFERPSDLETIRDELGLAIQVVEGVTRAAGSGPFEAESVRAALFQREVLDSRFNSPAIEFAPGRAVVVRVAERFPSEPIPLEDVADALREALVAERARDLATAARMAAQARVEAGEAVAEVALAYGGNWQRFESVTRLSQEVPRGVLEAAFRLPRPGASDKTVGVAELPRGGSAVVTVTRVVDGDLAAMTEAEADGLRRLVEERTTRLDFGGFYETLERDAKIRRRAI